MGLVTKLSRYGLRKAKKEVEDYKKIFEKLKSDDLKNENIQNADQFGPYLRNFLTNPIHILAYS